MANYLTSNLATGSAVRIQLDAHDAVLLQGHVIADFSAGGLLL